ncbi:sigma-54 interaction domain-containing protein [Peribacillus castrilensis]|uniref:Fis family PAS modulated sigma-54 specific transcriptional regulator n=1 Tax=Peribacillus simplex TaxID=1478 RepID=A0AAN2PID6_9BACI|nr:MULTISPECIES: sigma-54-dependent Fis family transcriptional regulator [Bacillaceae]MCF7621952.1 sigma-54-dependent Fis family transcriptional regulator [Peribacillus frigoritolerans]MCP1156164.1 sigma-54-dependent Fis family transcriptional regulator [Peribacillus frigoritolerans]MCT1391553.1 sigma-54-dependent Fis family transcriptional regulator [Peribacillus frigoritolerans]PAL11294.1 sigma-54-dependent Fis family transcriptional regulator [Peribacillus simplex]PRA86322.1 sigma-54-depend
MSFLFAFEEDQTFLSSIFDAIHDCVKIVDKDGNFIFINLSAERNMNIDREEWIGKNAKELLPNSVILDALHTGIPQFHKHSFVLNKNFIVHASPLTLNGDLVGAISTHKDGSEIEKLKESFDHFTINKYINYLENELHLIQMLPLEMKDFVISKDSTLIHELSKIKKLAPTDISILIRGESGVGKEVIAKNIHQLSNRMGKPYIPINCAAIPEALLESELFGYEEGAFTGAKKNGKKGKFELANKGTIFLDEIGDMSYHLQAKMLRVLQQKELVRVGGSEAIPLDVRVIAATNQDLESMIINNTFREDLYYRINGLTFTIPPLRERKMDIDVLILHYLKEFSYKYNKQKRLSQEAHHLLLNHSLLGNVRELINVLEHGFVLAENDEIQISDLPKSCIEGYMAQEEDIPQRRSKEIEASSFTLSDSDSLDFMENMSKLEVALIVKALKRSNNNRSKAIKMLGISRQSFYDRLKKYEKEISYYLK